jgi:hypothetical protein
MMDSGRGSSRLGAQPGPFVVTSVVIGVLLFPLVRWRESGDPLSSTLILSAFYGAFWAFAHFLAFSLRRLVTDPGSKPPAAPIRRGAIVGLAVGVPWFGGLVAFCLAIGEWGDSVYFAVPLLVVVVHGIIRLRQATTGLPSVK